MSAVSYKSYSMRKIYWKVWGIWESESIEKLNRKRCSYCYHCLCGFPNVNKVGKENKCCKVYSQQLLGSKAISLFIFSEYNFCLSFSFLLIWKGILLYCGRNGMHPILQLGKGNLFIVIDKTHKVNTLVLDYGQTNGCFFVE